MAPTPQFLAGQTLSASQLQQLATDAVFVPTLEALNTNPTLGTSPTQEGYLWLSGQMVNIWFAIGLGSGATAGDGNYMVPLPAAYPLMAGVRDVSFGTGRLTDQSSGARSMCVMGIDPTGQFAYWRTCDTNALVSHNAPWAHETGDFLQGHISYPTDFGL